ncbi:DEAD/DEAH box helicase [Congregibacter variabilis]|uniref:DEAD/DEAH box helicase n=1 Tax=Congregibacter variabilis TaxID=3081200 RepID=A0ABZ0I363_9GAMM|nr:DEAD/DEAH box helicase [Congregibacter sp. IMCC43200]
MNFDNLGLLPDLVKAVNDRGYSQPTPIQIKSIPLVLDGQDILAAAQTGTGKTAAFVLPILQRLAFVGLARRKQVRTLILTPTRELASQVHESVETYGHYLDLRSAVVFGGVRAEPQIAALERGVDTLVATPGRLLDLAQRGAVDFSALEVLVLDEADRMLDMGFIHDIRRIVEQLPKNRQTLMFSATFSKEIRLLAGQYLVDAVSVEVAPANSTTELVDQMAYPVDPSRKTDLLIHLLNERQWSQVLVFCRTKHGANQLSKKLLEAGFAAAPIHGNKSQNARQRALDDFKSGSLQLLVATDIAARGLDIDQLPEVVNFDLPAVPEDYVHRIGRTGRAGSSGRSHSLLTLEDVPLLKGIERLICKVIPRVQVSGFEPIDTPPSPGQRNTGASDKRQTAPVSRAPEQMARRSRGSADESHNTLKHRFNTPKKTGSVG